MGSIGANMPRLHGFHRFLPRLWELFFALVRGSANPASKWLAGGCESCWQGRDYTAIRTPGSRGCRVTLPSTLRSCFALLALRAVA